MRERIWVRIGDMGSYGWFHDVSEAVYYFEEREIICERGVLPRWRNGGFEIYQYTGDNYISMYWGDDDANFIRDLDAIDREEIEDFCNEVPLVVDVGLLMADVHYSGDLVERVL